MKRRNGNELQSKLFVATRMSRLSLLSSDSANQEAMSCSFFMCLKHDSDAEEDWGH